MLWVVFYELCSGNVKYIICPPFGLFDDKTILFYGIYQEIWIANAKL